MVKEVVKAAALSWDLEKEKERVRPWHFGS